MTRTQCWSCSTPSGHSRSWAGSTAGRAAYCCRVCCRGRWRCECAVASAHTRWQNVAMKTLVEIERAVEELPSSQRTELLLFVAQGLREEQAPLPEPRLFSDEQLRAWMDEDEAAMSRFLSAKVKSCCSEGESPSGLAESRRSLERKN